MIKGQIQLTEKEYRLLEELSYSSIKDFDKNRVRFYKKYILHDPNVKELDETESIILGSLVDSLITGTQEEFDKKYHSMNAQRGSGQMADFGDELWNLTKRCMEVSLEGEAIVTMDFDILMETAFNNVKYDRNGVEVAFKKKDFSWLLLNFQGSNEEILYKERRAHVGQTIITLEDSSKAEKIRDMLYETEWTRNILLRKDDGEIDSTGTFFPSFEVRNQLTIQFEYHGINVKSMLDRVEIDHLAKTIQPFDLKVSYLVNNFGYSYWKQKYYLQVAMYNSALLSWIKGTPLESYKVLPMQFIVADSTCQCSPVIYKCGENNLREGYTGFETATGRKVKGLTELINEISWCQENSIWTTPKEVYDNEGVMEIKPFANVESED